MVVLFCQVDYLVWMDVFGYVYVQLFVVDGDVQVVVVVGCFQWD